MVVVCSECGFQCRDNYNLQAHMVCHIPRSQRCVACKQIFSCDSDARKHRMTCDKYLRCSSCAKKFVSKRELCLHVAKHVEGRTDAHQLCPLCRTKYPHSQMNEHLHKDHAIDLEEERLWFKNMDDFKQWKNSVEMSTRSRYSTRNSKVLNNKRKCIHYRCHRNGHARTRHNLGVASRKRRSKNLGSIKINACCPAKMTLTQDIFTGAVQVVYVPTHVGHDFCLSRLPLTDCAKRDIVQKLSNNVSFDEILENSRQDTQDNLHRHHVLTRKTLHNIVRDFKLKNVNYGCGSQAKRKKESKVSRTAGDLGEQEDLMPSKENVIVDPNAELQSAVWYLCSDENMSADSAGEYQADMDILSIKLEDEMGNNEKTNASDPLIIVQEILSDTTCDQLYCQDLLSRNIATGNNVLDPVMELQSAVRQVDSDDDTFAEHAGESQAELEVSSVEKVIANNEQINVSEPHTIVEMLADMTYVQNDHSFHDLVTLNSESNTMKSRGPFSWSLFKTTPSRNDHLLQYPVPIKPGSKKKPNILRSKGTLVRNLTESDVVAVLPPTNAITPTSHVKSCSVEDYNSTGSSPVVSLNMENMLHYAGGDCHSTRKCATGAGGSERDTIADPELTNRLASKFLEILGRITNQEQVDATHESLLSLEAVISNLSDST